MFLGEMVILMAIGVSRDSGKRLLAQPVGRERDYIGYLCDSLVKRGFLKGNKTRGYELTLMGMKTLFEFLLENKNRARDMVKTLRRLGIECSQDVDELVEEAVEVT